MSTTYLGEAIIDEIIKQRMFTVSYPDPEEAHVFVWSSGAAEQIEAVVGGIISCGREFMHDVSKACICEYCFESPKEIETRINSLESLLAAAKKTDRQADEAPLVADQLQEKWVKYSKQNEEWGEDTRNKPKVTMHELAQLLESSLAAAKEEIRQEREGRQLACTRTAEAVQELATAKTQLEQMDDERLSWKTEAEQRSKALTAAKEEIAKLEKDKERLDWLFHYISAKEFRRIGVIYGDSSLKRQAIDAAMEESK